MTSMPFNLIGLAKLTESRQQEARSKTGNQAGDDFAALLREKADSNRWQSLGTADTRSASWRRNSYDASWHSDISAPQPKRSSAPSDRPDTGIDKLHDRRDDRAAAARGKLADPAHGSQEKAPAKDTVKGRKEGGKTDDDASSDTAAAAADGKSQADDSNNVRHHGKQDDASDQQSGQQKQGQQQAAQDGQTADGQAPNSQAADGQGANDQGANGQGANGQTADGLTVTAVPVTATGAAPLPKAGTTPALSGAATADSTGQPDPAGQALPLAPGLELSPAADLPADGTVADGTTKPDTTTAPSGINTPGDGTATAHAPLSIQQILVPAGKSATAGASIVDNNPLTAGPHKGLAEKNSQRDPAKIDAVRAPQAVVQSAQSQAQPNAAPVAQTQDSDAGFTAGFGNGDFGGFDNGTGNYSGFGAWPMSPLLTASPSKQADFIAALKQQLGNMTPQEQVAVQMQRAARDGVDKISIQLSPEELGRIHVKMDIDDDKKVRTTVTVERPATLDLLQRDSRALERALQEAGLKTDSGSLSFNLQRGNTGDFSGSGDWGQGGRQSSRTSGQAGIAGPADRITAANAPEIDTANGLVDVEV